MKNRKTATSRKRRRAITGAMWPSCAQRWKARWRCWVRRRPRWKRITTRGKEKYELLTLASRVAERSLASVEIVDLREDFQQTHQTSPISAALHAGLQECLANRTQALVLINRRGYSWSVLCRSCGASVQCVNCSISMTHHKQRNRLECHYCGSIQQI